MDIGLIEKRRAFLINILYFAVIVALFYFVMKTCFGLLLPFIAAFVVASVLQRPVHFLNTRIHVGRGPISAVFVLLILGVIGLLLFLLGNRLVLRVKGFYEYIMLRLQNMPEFLENIKVWLVNAIGFLPGSMRESVTETITVFFDDLIENGFKGFSFSGIGIDWSSLVSAGAGTIKDTVVKIPSVLIGIVISIVASVFMTIEYNEIKAFIIRQFPKKNREKIRTAKRVAITTLKKMFKAYGLIILITTTELCIGFYAMKLLKIFDSDYIVFLAFIIAVIDIIPVLGTGTVLIPWAVYSLITGNFPLGIGLIVIYAVILVVRQIIEPKLVAGQVGLSPIVTIIAMYVGTKLLSVVGFFILPFTVILIKKFNDEGIIHLFKEEEPAQVTAPAEAVEDPTPVEENVNNP